MACPRPSRCPPTALLAAVTALALPLTTARAQQCADNFMSSGSTWRGYTHETQAVFPRAHPLVVFAEIVTNMAAEGWRITASDPDTGAVAAVRTLSRRPLLTAPVTALVQPLDSGVSVSLHIFIDGAPGRRSDDVRDSFCRVLETAGGGGAGAAARSTTETRRGTWCRKGCAS